MRGQISMALATSLLGSAALSTAQTAELPPDRACVVVRDGHLSVAGERQRYWAAIGQLGRRTCATNRRFSSRPSPGPTFPSAPPRRFGRDCLPAAGAPE